MCVSMATGAVSLKKTCHIITLLFNVVVNDHVNYSESRFKSLVIICSILIKKKKLSVPKPPKKLAMQRHRPD